MAVACTSSRGAAVAARSGVVIAVLASPLVMRHGVAVLVEEPNHIGTAAFLLGAFLLIDRAPGWRFTGPLIGVILWIGQVGDATVRYLAVPAILLVAGYRSWPPGRSVLTTRRSPWRPWRPFRCPC